VRIVEVAVTAKMIQRLRNMCRLSFH